MRVENDAGFVESNWQQLPTHVIDDDVSARDSLCWLLKTENMKAISYSSASEFLDSYTPDICGCILMDVRMPEINGLELQEILNSKSNFLPVIIITGHANVSMAITAMKQGAFDFIRKPYRDDAIIEPVRSALKWFQKHRLKEQTKQSAKAAIETLTPREGQVMHLVVDGHQNKVIGQMLGISEKTVEIHRSRVMAKIGVHSVSELVRLNLLVHDSA